MIVRDLVLLGGIFSAPSFVQADVVDEAAVVVNLHTAGLSQLQTLPGIGQKKARAIVEYRARKGFRFKRDLLRIRGIGHRLFGQIRRRITLELPSKQTTLKNQQVILQ